MGFGKIYRLIRILSLDIIAGVIAGSLFAARMMSIILPWPYLLVIAVTAWIIYLSDHLVDGIKKKGESVNEIHRIFYKYKTPVILLIIMALIFDFSTALFFLPPGILQFGLIIGGATVLYILFTILFAGDTRVLFIKEIWISLIYTFAIWGGPVIYAGGHAESWQVMVMVSYGLLVMANVFTYSYYEYDMDIADRERTFAVDFGTRVTRIFITVTLILAGSFWITSAIIWGLPALPALIILALMFAGLLVLIIFPAFFRKSGSYGIWADTVFLIPFLILFSG